MDKAAKENIKRNYHPLNIGEHTYRFHYKMMEIALNDYRAPVVRENLTFEYLGSLCDAMNRFMAEHQFAFEHYIITIDSIELVPIGESLHD